MLTSQPPNGPTRFFGHLRVTKPAAKKPGQGAPRKERRRVKRDPITGSVAVIWGNQPHEENLAQANLVDVSPFGVRFR